MAPFPRCAGRDARRAAQAGGQLALDVLGENVDLEVQPSAGDGELQRRDLQRVRDQGHAHAVFLDAGDREAHALQADRALVNAVRHEVGGEAHGQFQAALAQGAGLDDFAHAVDMTEHEMAAQRRRGREGRLKVDDAARRPKGQRGLGQRFGNGAHGEAGGQQGLDRQAHAVAGNAVADRELRRDAGSLDRKAHGIARGPTQVEARRDFPNFLHDSREHRASRMDVPEHSLARGGGSRSPELGQEVLAEWRKSMKYKGFNPSRTQFRVPAFPAGQKPGSGQQIKLVT
jgi:hypothetical protein